MTVSANASDNVGVSRVELYVDGALLAPTLRRRTRSRGTPTTAANGGHSLQTRAYDAAGNVRLERGRGRHRQQRDEWGRADRERRLRGLGRRRGRSPATPTGPTGGYPHSGTGYNVLGADNNASGSEYQTVSIPAGHPANLTFWLNITTSESPSDRLRLPLRRGAEHVRGAARHARQLQQPERDDERDRVRAALVQPRELERADRPRPVPGDDRLDAADELPRRRRLAEVGGATGVGGRRPPSLRYDRARVRDRDPARPAARGDQSPARLGS